MSVWLALAFSSMGIAFTVVDPTNLNSEHGKRSGADQATRQTRARIDYEVKAAQRLIERMKGYDITKIKDMVNLINSFRNRARAIGYTYEGIENQLNRMYGKKGSFSKNFKGWQKQSDDSLKDAMVSQGLLEKSQKHMADLDKNN